MSAVILISMETRSQDEGGSCPCFSYEDVESIFQRMVQLDSEGGGGSCEAQDYSVEITAELTAWDQDFKTIAQASVAWFDFDPGRCEYIDASTEPAFERNISWPHPAPEATARACFDIISEVIAKSDTTGKCNTYP
jgi:hypothetical protein